MSKEHKSSVNHSLEVLLIEILTLLQKDENKPNAYSRCII